MVIIHSPSDSDSRGAEATAFIQCINGLEPQIHGLWYLVFDDISCKFHIAYCVEVTSGTVGEFLIDYLAENGRRIETTGQLSVNNSVQFLGLYNQAWESGLKFICNLLDHVEATGWGSANNYNQKWGGVSTTLTVS